MQISTFFVQLFSFGLPSFLLVLRRRALLLFVLGTMLRTMFGAILRRLLWTFLASFVGR